MQKPINSSKRKAKNRKTGFKKQSIRRIIDISLIVISVFAVVYIATVINQVSGTVTKIDELPKNFIRLQLVAPCNKSEVIKVAQKYFKAIKDKNFEIRVVDTFCIEQRQILSSLLISRESDINSSMMLADHIGMDESLVIYKELENNYNQISTTLVLGDDFEDYLLNLVPVKES